MTSLKSIRREWLLLAIIAATSSLAAAGLSITLLPRFVGSMVRSTIGTFMLALPGTTMPLTVL